MLGRSPMTSTEVSGYPRAENIASAAWVRRARRCRRRASRGSTAPAEAPRAAALLLTLVARERLRDHEPLDLARALEQRVDLGGRRTIINREVPNVSVAAPDRNRRLVD